MIIVIGVAGVGKSTQCRLLAESGNYQWLSVGQYLRDSVTDPEKKAIMLAGDRLDDDYVITMTKNKIDQLGDSPELLIDGFPRSMHQAQWLIDSHSTNSINISCVIHLTADEQVAKDRLEHRLRSDDTESAIVERFTDYKTNILPIIHSFLDAGIRVVDIDGQQPIEQVQADIRESLIKDKDV